MRGYNQGWRQESERHSLASRGVKTGTMKMMPTREYKAATFRDKSIRATVNIKLPDGTFIQRVPTYHALGNFQMMTVKYDGKEYLINEGDEYLRGEPEFYELKKELGKNKKPLAAKGKKASVTMVGNLEKKDDLIFVNIDTDVDSVKEYLGDRAKDYDAFFVKVKDGDYAEVWGIEGNVPYTNKNAYRLR